ncbi:uncharacterized protein LOC114539687 [Dendronephthya gigantea]|uniref:uncharacterized protein LOC114539687 n=1 Tax=Dendronephthya gigantea TaxID=151771 RepID=UPI00106BEE66|nr:uncharacterized protein LOC114539687 [Dendronephthya gigantea]
MALMYAWQRYFDASCTVMILATIFNSSIADRHRLQDSDSNRTCIPAEAEPILNSSSCYPLVNFTRPFCENHGIMLPKYVYRTPDYQIDKNEEMNRAEKRAKRLGESKIRSWFNINISKMQQCFRILSISLCHFIYPICDQTQSVYQEQKFAAKRILTLNAYAMTLWNYL